MNDFQSPSDISFGLIPLLLIVGIYVYLAFCQFRTAQKIGLHDYAWWAWIPIANTFLLFKMAGKPNWWFVLLLIPLVNLVCFAILWMETAKNAHVSPVWGFLVLVPIINFFALGIMAFSDPPRAYPTPPPHEPKPYEPERVG